MADGLTKTQLIGLVEGYFAAVDAQDLEATLSVFEPDCCLSVPTAGVRHCGRDTEIRGVFEALFARFESLWHGEFHHVVDSGAQTIASGFTVRNLARDGARDEKHNCNFFTVREGKFGAVFVYMMGQNTLTGR